MRTARIDDSLATVEIPVLIVRGECDYCIPEVAHQYERLIPGASLVDVEGAGHFVWLEKPDQLTEIVESFLSRD